MSWLRIDDGFEDHPKVEPLSDAAHRLWVRAACWCKKSTNEHTNGFVPEAMLEVISKRMAPKKRLLALARELVEARAGGMFECGLWEPTEGGWRFHDWDQYQPEGKPEPMTRAEAASLAGKRSAEARAKKYGTAQPRSTERPPNESPNELNGSVGSSSNDVHRTIFERPEPPDPDPDPDLPETTIQRPDRSGSAENQPSGGDEDEKSPGPCPISLVDHLESAGVFGVLAKSTGASVDDVRVCVSNFVAYWTIGEGIGRKRKHWARKARQWVLDQHSQRKLVGLGADERKQQPKPWSLAKLPPPDPNPPPALPPAPPLPRRLANGGNDG